MKRARKPDCSAQHLLNGLTLRFMREGSRLVIDPTLPDDCIELVWHDEHGTECKRVTISTKE